MEEAINGSFAVVTGASSGIGLALAREFAAHGFDLLLVADSPKINEAAETLNTPDPGLHPGSQTDGTGIFHAQIDLAQPEGVQKLYARIREIGRPVDALVLNAGVGAGGDFVRETSLDADLNVIDLNVRSTVHLAKLLLKDMVDRRRGRVLFTSSIAATMPGTFNAVYNASKAFVQSFAQAIRNELKDTGVTITALMPGPTDTNFFHRAGMEHTRVGMSGKDDAADVAKEGFEAMMAGKDHVVAGSFKNKVQATLAHVLPDTALAKMHRKQGEPEPEDRQ